MNKDINNIENKLNTEDIIEETKVEENVDIIENNTNAEVIQSTQTNENIDENLSLEDMERKKAEIKAVIAKEKEEKRQEQKNKRKKATKAILKSGAVASCCLCLGIGIGTGAILSKSYVSKQEQSNFKFDVNTLSESELEENIILTSNTASPIFKEVGDSVVNISTTTTTNFFYTQTQQTGSGSGIIYKVDGDTVYIITNNHVIEDASYVTISVTGEEQIEASLVGADPSSDLAVLKVSKQDMNEAGISEITVATFADSDLVEVGDFVFPIGNALGMGKTMTQGMISAQNKQINIDGKNLTVIQTDAAINPGNSGGALMNSDGEVVGINTAKLSSSAIEGIGYAIPSNVATQIAEQLINNGSVERPYFGIIGTTITENTKRIYGLNTDGVIVVEVEEDSNAEASGLKAGDIIISFNGQDVASVDDLSVAINNCEVNDSVSFEIIRQGAVQTLTVTFAPSNTSF